MTDSDLDDDKFAADIGAQLRRDELDVPLQIAQRLQDARRLAVAAADSADTAKVKTVQALWPRFVGVGAAAAAALVVAIALQAPVETLPRMDDAELAAAQEAELLEDLEFVAWMVALEESDDLPNSG